MTPQIATIVGLVIMFIVATALPINMGAVAFALAFIIGGVWVGLDGKEVLAGFPGDLFLTLVGITYLFAIAQKNGTIDLLVHWAVRAVRGRIVAIPWVMFVITGLLTAFGALGPAAVAIIGPVALRFAKQYRINPLMMGLLVIHGAQGGGFSPISVYGGITNKVVEKAGLDVTEMAVFLTSLGFNLMMAIICFCAFGGLKLMRRQEVSLADAQYVAVADDQASKRPFAIEGHGSLVAAGGGTLSTNPLALEAVAITRDRVITLVGLLGLGIAALVYNLNVGLVSITVAVALALISPSAQKGAELVHGAVDQRRGDLCGGVGKGRRGGLHRHRRIAYRHAVAGGAAGLLRRRHRLGIRLVGGGAGRHHPAGGTVPDAGPARCGRGDLRAGGVVHHRRCQPVLHQRCVGGGLGRQGRTRHAVPPLPGLQRAGGVAGAAGGLAAVRGAGLAVIRPASGRVLGRPGRMGAPTPASTTRLP